jgi:hypothetical protein
LKDFATVRRQERNFLRMLFLDPEFRARYVDWEPLARMCVGFVRGAVGTASEPRLAHLIGELSLSDPDFRTWWAERHVSYPTYGTRTLTHPLTGPYPVDWQVLHLPDDQLLAIMTAPLNTGTLEALRRLASVDAG